MKSKHRPLYPKERHYPSVILFIIFVSLLVGMCREAHGQEVFVKRSIQESLLLNYTLYNDEREVEFLFCVYGVEVADAYVVTGISIPEKQKGEKYQVIVNVSRECGKDAMGWGHSHPQTSLPAFDGTLSRQDVKLMESLPKNFKITLLVYRKDKEVYIDSYTRKQALSLYEDEDLP